MKITTKSCKIYANHLDYRLAWKKGQEKFMGKAFFTAFEFSNFDLQTNKMWIVKSYDELSKEELYSLLQLRVEVFVIEQDCPYQDVDGKDQKSIHVWTENEEGLPIAYLRIVEPGVSYAEPAIGRVVTKESHRKGGIGRKLMLEGIRVINAVYPGQLIRISAQEYLLNFYNELGFEQVGEGYLEDDIPHIEMIKKP